MQTPTWRAAAAAFFVLLVLSNVAVADFSLRSLNVFININADGSANVEERLTLLINGTPSRELYEATRSAYSDLATWKNRTGLSEMRHHISRANVDIANLRIIPGAIEGCNSFIGTCSATVLIDYLVTAGQNGSGLIKIDRYKPRTARYSLVQDVLSFEQTKTGELVLPTGTTISIAIPQAAEKICFSSIPQNLGNETEATPCDGQSASPRYYAGSQRTFTWKGDVLSKFQFTYEIESPLESEVIQFFSDSQKAVIQLFLGPEGLAAFILLAAAAFSLFSFNRLAR